ncbi:MAG: hypothetical protein NT165_02685 [Candidatus Falkowbacteria bacterium]|nr:hypothetical protein [Candidatus Falkowbacteria bacterium]
MRNFLKGVGIFIGVLVAFAIIGWFAAGNEFFMFKFFAPKTEQVRRETFEQSKAYNQGMIQELQNMQFQYEQADSAHKTALGSIILHRAADYDETKLPADLASFIQKLKNEKNKSKY